MSCGSSFLAPRWQMYVWWLSTWFGNLLTVIVSTHGAVQIRNVASARSTTMNWRDNRQREMFDLRKACKHCKPQSIKKYARDISRLYKLLDLDKLPENATWLKSEKLFKKYKSLPLNKRRALSVAGVKASQAYGVKNEKWLSAMVADVNAYIFLFNWTRSSQNKSVSRSWYILLTTNRVL